VRRVTATAMQQTRLNRRQFLAANLGLAAHFVDLAGTAAAEEPALRSKAAGRGLLFGAAVRGEMLRKDILYRDAVLRECGIIVPESEMKWGEIEKIKGRRDYQRADWLADFAARHRLELRGHTAVWWNNLPAWVSSALPMKDGASVLRKHVDGVVTHFAGRLAGWDIVNEAIEPKDGRSDRLRACDFLTALGPDYIAESFRTAHAADPKVTLYYNDFGLEYEGRLEEARREGTLRLLDDLKRQGVPVGGLGIQSHLKVGNRFDAKRFRAFLSSVNDLGLKILLSEFDVSDVRLAANIDERDAAVADHAAGYLETAFDEPAVEGLICWGLSDRYTWLNAGQWARADNLPNRSLPLDASMKRKPLWHSIARCIDAAPQRLDRR
jgi:endo-1,4-beta-xylanase